MDGLTWNETVEKYGDFCSEDEDASQDWALWLIAGPISLILAIVSTYGNLVSLKILSSLRIRKSIRFYLSVLAVANSAISQCTIWYYAMSETIKPFTGEYQFFIVLTVILHPISSFFLALSVWMVLTITVDRYFALAKPLHHRASDSRWRAKCVTAIVVLGAFCFSIPTFFELRFSRVCDQIRNDNSSSLLLFPTQMRLSRDYQLIYSVLANCIFISLGPLIIITCLSARMLCIVYAARSFRNRMDTVKCGKRKTSCENTTMMLLTVVAKFLVCNSPSLMLNLWENLEDSVQLSSVAAFKWCVELSNLLVTLNSASDAIVYLRWKQKQTRHAGGHTVIPKVMFTSDEASYLRNQYEKKRVYRTCVFDQSVAAKIPDIPLELNRMELTLDSIIQSIGDANEEMKLALTLNDLGGRYSSQSISAASWNRFKDHFVKLFSSGEDTKLWSRLICFIIREFRKGQQSSQVEQRSNTNMRCK